MGYPVTVDNFQQQGQTLKQVAEHLAEKQKDTVEHLAKKQSETIVDHNIDRIKENHEKWYSKFKEAEAVRREEEKNWRKYYEKVHKSESSWWQTVILFALNGIQLWALTKQYKQQEEIADRTYNLANRQLRIADEMYGFYKKQYQPQETELAKHIDDYFANPYRQQYEVTSGRFVVNAKMKFIGKRREALMCASQYCTGALSTQLNDIAKAEANAVANAMNSAVKYEDLREQKMKEKWLGVRLSFVQAGRGVNGQAIRGIDGAVSAFHSFGADPGAALSQLLTTIARGVGSIIPSPQNNAVPQGEVRSAPVFRTYTPTVTESATIAY